MTSGGPADGPEVGIRTVDEAAALLSSPTADLKVGVLRDGPALVVEDAHRLPTCVADVLAALPVVSVGIGPAGSASGFDVVVDDRDAAAAVVAGARANPMAAVTCCQVLRHAPWASTAAGLLAESTAFATLQGGPEFARWLEGRGRRVRPEEPEPPVLVTQDPDGDDEAVVLTLNRPRLRNAWSAAMRDALVDALRALAARGDDGPPIRLEGAGSAFCCGGDPAEFGTVDDPATAHLVRSSANAAPWLDRLSDRLTAVVHGPAVGAGVELAAFAGRVEATGAATFRLPEVSMGLLPGAGGTVSVPRRIGRQRSAWLCLTGATIDAPTALDWGLVDGIA